MQDAKPIALGLIGCGSFGRFCLDAFSSMDAVRIAAVADADPAAAREAAAPFGAAACATPDELIRRPDVDLVHVATPPSSHHELARDCLRAGKHVLCEKPLAMSVREADEIAALASRAGLLCPVNFVLRHNEVVDAAKRVLDSGALGKVLAGRLTNCAFDTVMPPDHWFWDKAVSGGIFIEHGVHFFDLYAYWLGPGEVLSAHTERREGSGIEDRVLCTLRHRGDGGEPVLVTHYHGFDQIKPMDRADHRLVCELGDVRVFGWIPLTLEVDAAVDDETQARLAACCPGAEIETVESYGEKPVAIRGRGVERHVARRIRLTWTPSTDKLAIYAGGVRALLADQIAAIRDPSHERVVTEANGRDAVVTAEAAAALADATVV